ncbi:MAG: threonine synthase, partial [Bacteroidetes bacterium]
MRFISTRNSDREFDLREAVTNGLAPDGGLFLPHLLPDNFVRNASGNSFPAFAASVLSPFLSSSFTQAEIEQLCLDTFTFDVPLIDLKDCEWSGISILELFHGPTHSFKDFGARFLGQLLRRFIADEPAGETKTVVLVATSGDTGSAVADGLSGIPGVEVIILYPENQVSAFQERQLTLVRKGVTACRVSGNFDECQKLVKASFSEPALRDVNFTSANSINIGRLLPQMTYYAWAASLNSKANWFCVPSGNLGNLTAGLLAWKGGMRSLGFIAGHNANRYFPDYLESGTRTTRASIRTLSNAMDVGSPSNFERLQSLFPQEELRKLVSGYS